MPGSAASTAVAAVMHRACAAGAGGVATGVQRARQREGAPPLVGARGSTLRLDSASPSGSRTVGTPTTPTPRSRSCGHPPDQRQLLVVLLAEVRAAGPHQVEELGHDGEHAGEVPGPDRALEHVAERARARRRPGPSAVRVHVRDAGRPDQVDAVALAQREVGVERARVAGEVLGRAELHRVDEDRRDHRRALVARGRASSAACPACSAPMVGTSPIGPGSAGRARRRTRCGYGRPSRASLQCCAARIAAACWSASSRPAARGPCGGAPGHRDVGRRRCRARCAARVPRCARDGGDVAARHRAGQRRVAQPQDVVQRRAEQRCDAAGPARRRPAAASSDSASLTSVTRWFEPIGERRVVERAGGFGHPHRLAAHLEHERLGHRPHLVERGDAERGAVEPVEVLGAAGERHHRVQREREDARAPRPDRARRCRARRTCARRAGPRARRPASASPATSGRRTSSGTASRTRSAPATTSSAGRTSAPGSRRCGPSREAADTPLAATTSCPARASAAPSAAAHAPDAEDADAEPRGSRGAHVTEPTAGPCVPDGRGR